MDVDAETFGGALLAASAADPGELLDQLRAQLRQLPTAVDLTMHLIDYRLASLRPIELHRRPRLQHAEPVEGSPLGAAFRTQQPTSQPAPAGHLWHVPISVRGQRLGVLTGTFTEPPSPPGQQLLASLALAAAHSLLVVSAGTDLYETSRRHGNLSLAAELQWQLLPARALQTRHFYIAGHLEPALRVAGDAFDFVVDDDSLTSAVIDAAGADGAPSWPTTLAVTALRNARRAGLPLHEQAALASDILWQHTAGRGQVNAILLQLDALTRQATVVHAGSPDFIRIRDGQLEPQTFDAQTPLGMFEDTEYAEQPIDLQPGDRIYLLTDGARTRGRTLTDLLELLGADNHGPHQLPPESVRRLVATLTADGEEPDDDITIVCLDWLP